jgi:hypothetical protein
MRTKTMNNGATPLFVAYPDSSLRHDINRLRELWHKVQGDRNRDAIFVYLTAVFELVEWWTAERREIECGRRALRINGLATTEALEPFAAVIAASVAPSRLDRRQLNKYSRALLYAAACDCSSKRLKRFINEQGGINDCAAECAWRLRRLSRQCREREQ